MRSSLAVNYTAHVADSQTLLQLDPLFANTSARADSKKFRSPDPLIEQPCSPAKSQREGQALFSVPKGDFAMPHRIDIDHKHSRAILKVVGQQLRASLKLELEQPESLRAQIERLRALEEPHQILPVDEREEAVTQNRHHGIESNSAGTLPARK
ncbi:hypothetical protein, partial [Bradyrhizobium elkanii]|uniref:hypothetical protein n=2 Tax=Nitrobacteraceae TaxID=41294 RepID=UPI001AEC447D